MCDKTIICAMIVLLIGGTPITLTATQPLSAENVLKQFLKLDYEGYRLSSKGYRKINSLTTSIDLGSDACIVVRGYKIGKTKNKGDNKVIQVSYDVLGMSSGGVEWIQYIKKDKSVYFDNEVNVNYELTQINGDWKIIETPITPHISLDVALRSHESNLPGPADDPKIQQDMKKVVDILRKLKNK